MTRVEDGSHESVEKSVAAFVLLAAKARLSQRVPQAVAPHHGLQDRLPSKCLHPIIGCWALKNLEILCVSLFYELLVNLGFVLLFLLLLLLFGNFVFNFEKVVQRETVINAGPHMSVQL